ncbi:hypothetical protein [Streptomyces sp. NPDC048442]|uniref:hypothetical protein n=1 Tax=Streptomyces sp. NPDC048442 TaxID=3154823 RepID=UPI00342D98B2
MTTTRPAPVTTAGPALVAGGTGMLAGLVTGLVADGCPTAVLARSEQALDGLAAACGGGPDGVIPVPGGSDGPGGSGGPGGEYVVGRVRPWGDRP